MFVWFSSVRLVTFALVNRWPVVLFVYLYKNSKICLFNYFFVGCISIQKISISKLKYKQIILRNRLALKKLITTSNDEITKTRQQLFSRPLYKTVTSIKQSCVSRPPSILMNPLYSTTLRTLSIVYPTFYVSRNSLPFKKKKKKLRARLSSLLRFFCARTENSTCTN